MERCPACKSAVETSSRYCGQCGAEIPLGPFETVTIPERSPRHPTSSTTPNTDSKSQHGRFVPGAILAGRFRIVAKLGAGGMGEVYRADDLELNHSVALKFLPPALAGNAETLARFRNEVRIARQVSHPNVCRVYDIGTSDGELFLTMEYVDGEDLASMLRRLGRPSREKAIEIVRQLCAGLATAHSLGVLHRDLKPSNIMIDGRGRVRITDFGLAAFAHELQPDDARIGTPAYMAPEQAAGQPASIRTEIYSLGLILFELFSGKRFDQVSTTKGARASHDSPDSTIEFDELNDPEVAPVIERCLSRDPNRRPKSVLEVTAALPGGDPLAAALAVGEIPSPELVAASGDVGTMPPRLGIAIVASIVVGLVLLVGLNSLRTWRTGSPNLAQLQVPPVVLLSDSQSFLHNKLRLPEPADFAHGVSFDERSHAYFWYREHAYTKIVPVHFAVSEGLPSPLNDGSTGLRLDGFGHLVQFLSTPASSTASELVREEPNWQPFFELAGLDISTFTVAEPRKINPVSADLRQAWTGRDPRNAGKTLRIEAASLRGRSTFFDVDEEEATVTPSPRINVNSLLATSATLFLGLFRLSLFIGIAALAIRNVVLGRGYSRGAFRTGFFVTVLCVIVLMLDATHSINSESESRLIRYILAMSVWNGAMAATMYLAIEPYIRRTWPAMLTSWTRLVSGRWRDPLVGRDILIGIVPGVLLVLFHSIQGVIGGILTPPLTAYVLPDSVYSPASLVSTILEQIVGRGVLDGFIVLFVLVALLTILRRTFLTLIGLGVVLFIVIYGLSRGGPLPGIVVASAAAAALPVVVLYRFGLLALMSYLVTAWMLPNFPLDVGAWYFERSVAAVALLPMLGLVGLLLATRRTTTRSRGM